MNFPDFCGGAARTRTGTNDLERCVNLYPEFSESRGAKERLVLYGTPGLAGHYTFTAGNIRGLYTASNGRCFVVAGNTFYELLAGAVATAHGTLGTSSGPVSMADNGLQVIVVDGSATGGLFTFNPAQFRALSSATFYGADRAAYFDGYFVLNRPGTQQIYISALLDGFTYDGLDFASDESSPDRIVSLMADRRELITIGTRSGQFWSNIGGTDFPLAPIGGTAFNYGCAAAHSLCSLGTFYWLGQEEHGGLVVLAMEGYQPRRISTHALEYAMNGYSTVSDAVGYVYQEEGHAFYALSFPAGNATWVYDASTKLWHERADWDGDSGLLKRHRVQYHAYAFSTHFVGGQDSGTLYRQNLATYTNDGAPLVARRTSPIAHDDRRLLYHNAFELDMETGVGLDGGVEPGTTPQVALRWTDDNGHTWSTQRWATAGASGAYGTRVLWRRLGRSRNRAYEVTITDPVRRALVGARIEVS